jgi:hypothetical protein
MAQDIWPFRKDVVVKPEVVFVGSSDEKGLNAVSTPTSETVTVRVREPFRVVHEGRPYTGGDVLEVPNNDSTALWIKAKWVEGVPVSQKGKA